MENDETFFADSSPRHINLQETQRGPRRLLSLEENVAEKINDIRQLLEAILCLDAWCQYGDTWSFVATVNQETLYLDKMKKVIEQVVSTLPRKDGNGWKLQKTHELLHLPHFTSRFGHPQNYDSGPGESALKQHAKKPARTSQKRSPDEFIRQVSSRIDDVEVIQRFEKGDRRCDKNVPR